MFKWLKRKLTNNYTEIPIILVTFDYQKYVNYGNEGSCDIRTHPVFKDDEYVTTTIKELITHIREKYDMEKVI